MSTAEKYDLAGGPAFPVSEPCEHGGMTLRDYFAGQAIVSIPLRAWGGEGQDVIEAWAKCAYSIADAMLERRELSAVSSPHEGGGK